MKVQATYDFSDEQRMALGSNGEKASPDAMRAYIIALVDDHIGTVVADYFLMKHRQYASTE